MEQFPDEKLSLDCHILYLRNQACQHGPRDLQRRVYLTQLVRCIERSGRLWTDPSPYYEDALQMTWVYCCRNLCEACTSSSPHNQSRSSVITWLNAYLKWRLHDLAQEQYRKKAQIELSSIPDSYSVWNASASRPEVPPILEETKAWVKEDRQGLLRSLHLKNNPDITAQYLILKRLPPETSWQDLSNELRVSISTLSSFYRRNCLPSLREFGKHRGYLV